MNDIRNYWKKTCPEQNISVNANKSEILVL